MTDGKKDDLFPAVALEALFNEARGAQDLRLPEDLTARILADAEQAASGREAPPRAPRRRAGWGAFLASIGGIPALAGLAAATVAGIWIGVTPPDAVQNGMQAFMGTASSEELFELYVVDSADGYGFDEGEG